ncbi:MAG: hypothetical protein ACREJC_02380 [Tepidisphaeraceae bacterium]
MPQDTMAPSTPRCSNCGYDLTGLTESSKCPECGRPLVEILTRGPALMQFGKRYRSNATLCGLPVIDIALGPKNGEMRGHARGIIAIGDFATGWLAIGGFARGIVAIGGFAMGFLGVGGMSAGLVGAMGGLSVGALSTGGLAAGILATGGCSLGVVAQGGLAIGHCVRGGQTMGNLVVSAVGPGGSPAAAAWFDRLSWFFGSNLASPAGALQSNLLILFVSIAVSSAIGLIAAWRMRHE